MILKTFTHEDDRRILTEWIQDISVKSVKSIYVKEKSILGNHYHNKKDEIFYIQNGKGICILKTPHGKILKRQWMFEGECIYVPKGTVHSFEMFAGSILLEAATEPYNHEDEIPFVE